MVHMQETDSSNAFPLSNSIGDTYSHFEPLEFLKICYYLFLFLFIFFSIFLPIPLMAG